MTITTILDLELYQMYNDSSVLGGIAHDVSGNFFQKKTRHKYQYISFLSDFYLKYKDYIKLNIVSSVCHGPLPQNIYLYIDRIRIHGIRPIRRNF